MCPLAIALLILMTSVTLAASEADVIAIGH
jgi:hypothetical protein